MRLFFTLISFLLPLATLSASWNSGDWRKEIPAYASAASGLERRAPQSGFEDSKALLGLLDREWNEYTKNVENLNDPLHMVRVMTIILRGRNNGEFWYNPTVKHRNSILILKLYEQGAVHSYSFIRTACLYDMMVGNPSGTGSHDVINKIYDSGKHDELIREFRLKRYLQLQDYSDRSTIIKLAHEVASYNTCRGPRINLVASVFAMMATKNKEADLLRESVRYMNKYLAVLNPSMRKERIEAENSIKFMSDLADKWERGGS